MARLKTLGNRVATQGDRMSTAPPATWRAGKTTANQRGYNYAWQKVRLVHLGANPLCVYCPFYRGACTLFPADDESDGGDWMEDVA